MIPKLVSVIITNYNYAEFISQAVESVLQQEYKNIEIIIVDDGSTDNSLEVLSKFGNSIKVIKKKNGGVSSARNLGTKYSSGEYIAFLDADDYWDPRKLAKQVCKIEDSNSDLVYCTLRIVNLGKNDSFTKEIREGDFLPIFAGNPGKTPFPPSSVLMTRSLVQKVGEWQETLFNAAEDFDFFRRCSIHTKFFCVEEALVIHREHERSLTSGSLDRYYFNNALAMISMFHDERMKMGLIKKSFSNLKFQVLFIKTFLKQKRYVNALEAFLSIFKPLYCLEKHLYEKTHANNISQAIDASKVA